MKKETKEVGRELHPGKGGLSLEGNFKKRGFQTPGNTLPAESVAKPWKHRGQHNRKGKIKK